MTNKEPIPKFATEAEEAQWWYEQRDRLGERAEAALARGELKPRRLTPSPITGGSGRKRHQGNPKRALHSGGELFWHGPKAGAPRLRHRSGASWISPSL